jgi:cytochrome c oxidase assembly protein subunit 15
MGVGFLLIILTLTAWVKRSKLGNNIGWASLGLLLLVMVQGAFGAWTVTLKLQPIIVTIHLMLGLLLLCGLALLTEFANPNVSDNDSSSFRLPVWVPLLGIFILLGQIFLGGWVSTNYAVLACTDFPLCQGQLVPDMDFHNGFTWWRELGKTSTGEFIDLKALVAIHWMHRLGAFVALLAIAYIWRLASKAAQGKSDALSQRVRFWAKILGWLGILQLLTGLSNVVLEWPLVAALAHTAGAAALLVCMTKLTCLANKTS